MACSIVGAQKQILKWTACALKYNTRQLSRSSYLLLPQRKSDADEPVKYSASQASTWKAIDGFTTPQRVRNAPWYQPIVVCLSTTAFLIYFLVLREENDLDEEIGNSLYNRIPGLEEKNLLATIEHERLQGRTTTEFESRLSEVRSNKTSI